MVTTAGKKGGVEGIGKEEEKVRNTDCMGVNDPNGNKNISPVTLETINDRRLRRWRKY